MLCSTHANQCGCLAQRRWSDGKLAKEFASWAVDNDQEIASVGQTGCAAFASAHKTSKARRMMPTPSGARPSASATTSRGPPADIPEPA